MKALPMQKRHLLIARDLPGLPTENETSSVQTPSVIRTPVWLDDPPGAYLLYFAHHWGASIRLAAANHPTGPWRLVSTNVLHMDDVGPALAPDNPNGPVRRHIASPDVHIDDDNQMLRMYFHGPVTTEIAGHLPTWGAYPNFDQYTLVAMSSNGRNFQPTILRSAISPSYHRGFVWDDCWYGLSMPSRLVRSSDGFTGFEYGPTLFDDPEIRHAGVLIDGHVLRVWFTRVGDAPERILETQVDLRGNWTSWSPSEPTEVLRPVEAWEGADIQVEPSIRGPAFERENGLRDPFVLDDGDARWLFYAAAGEFAIGVVRLPDAL